MLRFFSNRMISSYTLFLLLFFSHVRLKKNNIKCAEYLGTITSAMCVGGMSYIKIKREQSISDSYAIKKGS